MKLFATDPLVSELLQLGFRAAVEKPADHPDCLYHYSSAASVLEILRSKSIWASSIGCLNDTSEMAYGYDVLRKVPTTLWSLNPQIAPRLTESFQCVYVACFCALPDLLSQWRAYGEDCAGFSIGLDFEKLGSSWALFRIIYDSDEQQQLAKRLIDQLVDKSQGLSSDREKFGVAALSSLLLPVLCRCKHSAFSEEHEWRAIAIGVGSQTEFRSSRRMIVP
jgi:hypothetical protein